MMKTKAAADDERQQFDQLKSQLSTLQGRLTDHASAEQEAARSTKPFGKSSKGGMMAPDTSVYFDDFARKQPSPTRKSQMKSQSAMSSNANPMTMSRPTNAGGACEWDRLMQEREELLKTGSYSQDDPLIREIERQINASQLKDQKAEAGQTTFNQRISAQ